MTSLQNLTAIEARLDVLFAAEPRDNALISELQRRAARLGALLLAETQLGEMLVCFTTVMLDEFNVHSFRYDLLFAILCHHLFA